MAILDVDLTDVCLYFKLSFAGFDLLISKLLLVGRVEEMTTNYLRNRHHL